MCECGSSQMWRRSRVGFVIAFNEFEVVWKEVFLAWLDTVNGMPEGTNNCYEDHQAKMWELLPT
jgi:hypothetical protein